MEETEESTRKLQLGSQPLVRRNDDQLVAGVCAALARHLQLPVIWIRAGFVLLGVLYGAGIVGYFFLWVTIPQQEDVEENQDWLKSTAVKEQSEAVPSVVLSTRRLEQILLGGVLLAFGSLLFLDTLELGITAGSGTALAAIVAGLVLLWKQLDAVLSQLGAGKIIWQKLDWISVSLAAALLLSAVFYFAALSFNTAYGPILLPLAVIALLLIAFAPWWIRTLKQLSATNQAKLRSQERSTIAAHLHDSVLQTLALIQVNAEKPGEVVSLARAQELELRQWLYGYQSGSSEQLAAELAQAVTEAEGIAASRFQGKQTMKVELVSVGDTKPSPETKTLVQASKEAVLNALVHGEQPVSCFLEVTNEEISVFVRDRGKGFQLAEVPVDRLGVRKSIIDRMKSAGGEAEYKFSSTGTEVILTIPTRDQVII